jgi:hypothetical protein
MSLRFSAILLVMLVIPTAAPAQWMDPPARNAAYVELLGNGGPYSLNFERRIAWTTSIRVGFAKWTESDPLRTGAETRFMTFPVLLNVFRRRGSHHLELGGGVLLGNQRQAASLLEKPTSNLFSLTGVAGYRYQKRGPGLMFRAGITPFYSFDEDSAYPEDGFVPSVGVSFGYAF